MFYYIMKSQFLMFITVGYQALRFRKESEDPGGHHYRHDSNPGPPAPEDLLSPPAVHC